MTVGEARVALAGCGQRALPVVGHDSLIGLITVEALSGHGVEDHDQPPAADASVLSVMDWHLVQVPPGADDHVVVASFTDAAQRWLTQRRLGTQAPTPHLHWGGPQ